MNNVIVNEILKFAKSVVHFLYLKESLKYVQICSLLIIYQCSPISTAKIDSS